MYKEPVRTNSASIDSVNKITY